MRHFINLMLLVCPIIVVTFVILMAISSFSSCAPIKFEAAPVEVIHKIDLSDIERYFAVVCQDPEVNMDYDSPEECQEAKVAEFIGVVGDAAS